MDHEKLSKLLNASNRITVLSTVDPSGAPNSAVFGSVRLLDEKTLLLGMGDNRSLSNLASNPRGTLLAFIPGSGVFSWRGARLYLETQKIEETGPLFESLVSEVEKTAGRPAAKALKHLVTFRIVNIRPLADFSFDAPAEPAPGG